MTSGCSEKQRLWVVTDCYYPDAVPTGEHLSQIAEGMTEEFDVRVICGRPSRLSRGIQIPGREMRNGVEIFRVWGTQLDKNVFTKRIVNLFTFGFAIFWRSLRSFRQGDRVLVATAPPNLPFTTAIASLVRGCSYSLLIHDLYPDQLVALGKLKDNSVSVNVMHFANAWLFKHAARILVGGDDMAELVSARTYGSGVPIKTIPYLAKYDSKDELSEIGKPEQSPAEKTLNFDASLQRYLEALR